MKSQSIRKKDFDSTSELQEKSYGKELRSRLARDYGILGVLVVIVIFFIIAAPNFGTISNLINILNHASVIGIVSIGMTFVILTKGIDLSVGSLLALTSLVGTIIAVNAGESILFASLAFVMIILVGAFGGAINGALISSGYVSPLIATLATLTAYRGIAVWWHVNPVYGLPDWYRYLGTKNFLDVPLGVYVFGIIIILASFVLNRTRFGRQVYAVGGNEHASRASGIRVAGVQFTVYVLCGACVGLAALIETGRIGAGQSYAGVGLELQAIAAVVVGGVSLFGGRGKISNTVVGVLVLGVLFNGLVLMNVPAPLQNVIIGLIIASAAAADVLLRKKNA
jgi:ribose/xylose/arabinose/galactoside ABC-type transport system permease subunit